MMIRCKERIALLCDSRGKALMLRATCIMKCALLQWLWGRRHRRSGEQGSRHAVSPPAFLGHITLFACTTGRKLHDARAPLTKDGQWGAVLYIFHVCFSECERQFSWGKLMCAAQRMGTPNQRWSDEGPSCTFFSGGFNEWERKFALGD